MLETVKLNLRIRHSKLDLDIQGTIDACLLDAERVGIHPDPENALVKKLVQLYCRWHYNFEGQAELYRKSYESLRAALSLAGDYRGN